MSGELDVFGFEVPYPDPFWSTSTRAAEFAVSKTLTENSVIRTYRGGPDIFTQELCLDARLLGHPLYAGITRETSHWQFTAVRTVDDVGHDRSTVTMTATAYNRWNIRRPRDNIVLSRNGFEVHFKSGTQIIHSKATGNNFTGNMNGCSEGVDTLEIPPFDIPNSVFEAFDNVIVQGKPELYYACP